VPTQKRIPWFRSVRTKILLPSVVLFAVFAVLVVVGAVRLYTSNAEKSVIERLRGNGVLIDAMFREEEARTTLHARFMADMVRLAEQFSEEATGRSALVYPLEYLQESGVDIHIHSTSGPLDDPYGHLVRKGAMGIRTTSLILDSRPQPPILGIASAAPIERGTGIGEVIIGVYRLTDDRLLAFKEKMGVDVTLVRDGLVAASTFEDPECRQAIGRAVAVDGEQEILLGGPIRVRDLACSADRQKMVLRPMEVGFKHEAVCVLSVSVADLLAARERIARGTLLAAGLILIVALAIYSLLVRKFTQPLKDLARLTQRVAAGDFDARATITARDEIGALEESHNSMIERLSESQQEIEELHRRELERTHRLASIGELASGIAHEVRNPLAGISGAIQILRREGGLKDDREEILDEVQRQISRMEKLTRDLLDYSRPSDPKPEMSDLHQVLEKAIFLASMGLKDGDVRIKTVYDTTLPDVYLDPEKIQQVFLNILINATQALSEGGTIQVRTGRPADDGDGRLLVEFADDGVGMSPETQQKAMRPFFTTKHQGTGLGLSIVRQIMQSHSGDISIRCDVGQGTTISLVFPEDARSNP
jgi:signal transduction histidine kinase